MLLLSLLAACAGSPEASLSLAFASTRDMSIVILGTSVNHAQREEVRAGRSLWSFWVEYDPDTLRLVPGGKTFLSKVEGGVFSEPRYLKPTVSVLQVEPGYYALIGAGFPHLMTTFVASKQNSGLGENMGELETWTHTVDPRRHIDPAAEVGRGRNFRFTVLPGVILYIGHFEFLKWDFRDRLRSLSYFQDRQSTRLNSSH